MTENLALYARMGFIETHRAVEQGFSRVFMQRALGAIDRLDPVSQWPATPSTRQATPRLPTLKTPDKEAAIDKAMKEFGIEPARRFRLIAEPVE